MDLRKTVPFIVKETCKEMFESVVAKRNSTPQIKKYG
jgi:hypothetical protein